MHLTSSSGDLVIATLVLSLTTFTMGAMQTILTLYAESLGATVEQWGLMAAMWGLSMAVGEPFWGWVHDHVDRIAPLIFRAINGTLIFLFVVLVPVVWPLFLLNLWRGFSDAAPWPASRSMVSKVVSSALTALAMAILWAGARLGLSLGALASGQVANVFGYKYALLLSALVSSAAVLLIVPRFGWPRFRWYLTTGSNSSQISEHSRSTGEGHGFSVSQYKPFLVLGGVTMLSSLGWGALTFLPFFVTSSLGGSVADVGMLFTLSGLATAFLLILVGGMGDRIGRKKMVVSGLMLYALSVAGIGFAQGYGQVLGLMLLGGVGQAASRPSIEALVSEASSPEERGRIMGLYGTCEDVGGIVGPLLGGLMWGIGGPPATFFVCGCLIGTGSILAMVAVQSHRPARQATAVLW